MSEKHFTLSEFSPYLNCIKIICYILFGGLWSGVAQDLEGVEVVGLELHFIIFTWSTRHPFVSLWLIPSLCLNCVSFACNFGAWRVLE